ncbi:hypothetical protein [Gallaecimonas sp. GXIMD1310]|uniref:hypothetical protein n=1 Tax=Gallaecimonas sp. GXIMD1310 TaxID=3131926 RepID=UPI0032466BCB
MKALYRYPLILALLIAAITAYHHGSATGVFAFVILGFGLEAAFWAKLFNSKKSK